MPESGAGVRTLSACCWTSFILVALVALVWWLLSHRAEEAGSDASPSSNSGGGPQPEGEAERSGGEGVSGGWEAIQGDEEPSAESFAVEAGTPVETVAEGEQVSGGWEAIQGGEEPSGGWESLGEEESFAVKAEPGAEEPSAGREAIRGEDEAPAEAKAAGGEGVSGGWEAIQGGEKPSGGWESLGAEESFAVKAEAPAKPDDLKRIEGIGPKIAELLNEAGITTFAQLAATDVETLRQILVKAGRRFALASPETWPEQAALAARGEWEALAQLQDSLKGGRR